MTVAIQQGATTNVSTPRLILTVIQEVEQRRTGFLDDPAVSLEFQIFDVSTPAKEITPIQVFPGSGREAVNTTTEKVSLGRFAPTWTVDAAEPVGRHIARYFYKLATGEPERTVEFRFEVVTANEMLIPGGLITISELREEGLDDCTVSSNRAFMLIQLATAYIEAFTGRFFEPRLSLKNFDGARSRGQLLREPIIAVEEVFIDISPFQPNDLPIDRNDLRVYNRHIREGLLDPDDREAPRIDFFHASPGVLDFSPFAMNRLFFPEGEQNVHIRALWGYTDPDGSLTGETPLLIKRAALMFVERNLPKVGDEDFGGASLRSRLTREKTRDQAVAYASPSSLAVQGHFTGDSELDTILAMFRVGPRVRVA